MAVAVKSTKKILLLILLFLQIACGTKETREFGEFEPYITQFELEAAKHHWPLKIISLTVKFGTLPSQTLAMCTVNHQESLITVNETRWSGLSNTQKTIVLYHELGHCVLNRRHDNSEDPKKEKKIKSIMHAHPLIASDYELHEDAYLAELFFENSDNQ